MNELTHLDLCTGIGGFALASRWAEYELVGYAEIEPEPCAHIARRFPGVRNYGSIRTADFATLRGRVTCLTAGYPCQPFSYAGVRRGTADDRHLWPAVRSAIQTVRPSWVICENVLGHVTMGLDQVLSDLEIDGYASQSFIIPACAVGAWQERYRVWIVAHAESERCGEARGLRSNEPAQRSAGRDQKISISGAVRAGRGQFDLSAQPEEQTKRLLWHGAIGPDELRLPCWNADFAEVLRMADGVSLGLDSHERRARIKALGNAIVPQIPAHYFRWIAQIERGEIVG